MAQGSPRVPTLVSVAIISLAAGCWGGFVLRGKTMPGGLRGDSAPPRSAAAPAMGSPGMAGGGESRDEASAGYRLARTVRGLAAIQRAQGQGVTPEQATTLLPALQEAQAAERIDEAKAAELADRVEGVLTPPQRAAIAVLFPQRGRRPVAAMSGMAQASSTPTPGSARPSAEPAAPGPGGAATGPIGPGVGGGMRGRPDPERPFASERNQEALSDLIRSLGRAAR